MTSTPDTVNDVQAIERVRHSDHEAFRLLFEKYQPILFRNLLYTLGDGDTAHDIVQETFVRVWQHRSSLQPELPFLTYLFHISRNLVRDRARRSTVRRGFETDIPAILLPTKDDPEGLLQDSMLQEALAEAIRTKLPSRCREIFLLSRMEGMSHAEISRHLGITVKTVENQITRALKILRRSLRWYL
jgi:RNA polymerase sigma-70 factor (ECF subfamily)